MTDAPLHCPFCGWDRVNYVEEKAKRGVFKGSLYSYCLCRICGAHGLWAYCVADSDAEEQAKCVERWNERREIPKESELL